MQALKIILVLITIGCIVGPVGAVVIIYRNNLSQLVITPQIQQLTHSGNNNSNNNGNNNNNNSNNNGNNNPNGSNNPNNNNNSSGNNGSSNGNSQNNNNSTNNNNNNGNNNGGSNNNNPSGVNPVYMNGQINTAQITITLTFSITNSLTQDTTINSMSGIVEITEDQYQLGTVSLQHAPITISSGQSITVTVSGALTQDGQSHLAQDYKGVTSLDITVVNGSFTEDGVINQSSQPQDLGVATVS